MLERLAAQERRRGGRASRGDAELGRRAGELSQRYFDGRAIPASVRWVANQGSRWGSCTPADATIRLSDRLRTMPSWVIDYVLVHELAHLLEFGHGPRFRALVDRYPKAERARGYLLGVTAAAGEEPAPSGDLDDGADTKSSSETSPETSSETSSEVQPLDAVPPAKNPVPRARRGGRAEGARGPGLW